MEPGDITENDIERILVMLNMRNRQGLIPDIDNTESKTDIDTLFYGIRRQYLPIIKTYKLHFYYLMTYIYCESEDIKQITKDTLRKLQGSETFLTFIEEGTKFSVEDCRLLDFNNLNFYESVEKTKQDVLETQSHVYKDVDCTPKEFYSLLDDGFVLNYIQRVVSNVAFNSNDNFLVCAPTGIGKTIISAMRMYKLKCDLKNQVKIAYVAPIKALAKEVCCFLSKTFKDLKVVLATSDADIGHKELERSNIIVGTPEKVDLIMRNTFITFDLIVFDEIHILNDTRGFVIEGLVARAMRTPKTSLIGMSATIYNYEDVGIFLGVSYYNIFYFRESHRPSPLSYDVILAEDVDKELDEIVVETDLPLVVFVHSKKDTLKTAEHIKQYFDRTEAIYDLLSSENDILKFDSLDLKIKDLVLHQIGIHHSALDSQTRLTMESFFKKGILKILVSTSTLAWGVNLPIKNVIIKGSRFYNAEVGDYVELSNMEIRQMFGRAGRYPNMVGCKGVLISSTTSNIYFNQTIESNLLPNICNLVLAELFLGINTFKGLMEWFSNTFYVVRLMKYNQNGFKLSKDILYTSLTKLREAGMIEGFQLTHCGKIAVKYFLDYKDVYNLHKKMLTEKDLLDLIGQMTEFKNLKDDFDTQKTGLTSFKRLFQNYLNGCNPDSEIVTLSNTQIQQNFPRIASAVFELAVSKGSVASLSIFEYLKCFEIRTLPGKSPFRNLKVDTKIVEAIEEKKIPYKIFRNLTEDEFKEMGIDGFQFLKYLPNFEIGLKVFCGLKDTDFLLFEIEKKFKDTKIYSIKYLFVIRDFNNTIILSDVVYFYKEVDTLGLCYCIPKRRYIQVEIISFEFVNSTISKAFDLNSLCPIYKVYEGEAVEDCVRFNISLEDNVNLVVYDQNMFEIALDDVLVVRNREMKCNLQSKGFTVLTYTDILQANLLPKDRRYILLDTHRISETGLYLPVIECCRSNEINLCMLGFPPLTKIDKADVYASQYGNYWDRVHDLTYSLLKTVHLTNSLSHLVVVANYNILEVLRNVFKSLSNVTVEFIFFKDIDTSLKPPTLFDIVHVFDTQYFDYSTSSLCDYRLPDFYYFSRLGMSHRFYLKKSKVNLYFSSSNLQILYKYRETEESKIINNPEDSRYLNYILRSGLSLASIKFLEGGLKNNMGIKSILRLIFQIDELLEEVVYPEYVRDVELGMKFIKIERLMKNRGETDKILVPVIADVLNLLLDICMHKDYLKTMFNIIFILQKLNKLEDKFYEVVKDKEFVVINVSERYTEEFPVIFYVVYEDSTFERHTVTASGIYRFVPKRDVLHFLCEKVAGYEKIKI